MAKTASRIISDKLMGLVPKIENTNDLVTKIGPAMTDIQQDFKEVGRGNSSLKDDIDEVGRIVERATSKIDNINDQYNLMVEKLAVIAGIVAEHDELLDEIERGLIDTATLGLSLEALQSVHEISIIRFLDSVNLASLKQAIAKIDPDRRKEICNLLTKK